MSIPCLVFHKNKKLFEYISPIVPVIGHCLEYNNQFYLVKDIDHVIIPNENSKRKAELNSIRIYVDNDTDHD